MGEKYFGKIIAGKDEEEPRFYSKYDLSNRKYLGPTSTDYVLSFIMCNLAQIKQNDIVLDPFVGTGSLLIGPAHFKSVTFGCDIDIRVLKGFGIGYTKIEGEKKTKKRDANVFTNFINYNLIPPQIIRADINYPVFRNSNAFDTIICDPPYGHRAFTRRKGKEEKKKEKRKKRIMKKYEDKNKKNEMIKNEKEIESNEEQEDEEDEEEEIKEELVNKNDGKLYFAPLKQCSVEQIFENLLHLADLCLKKKWYFSLFISNKKE